MYHLSCILSLSCVIGSYIYICVGSLTAGVTPPPPLASPTRGYNPLIGLDVLCVQPVSKAQSWQRCGRAGREGPGICYRLYTEETFQVQYVCMGGEGRWVVCLVVWACRGTPYKGEGAHICLVVHAVEPLYSGHHWDPVGCPV